MTTSTSAKTSNFRLLILSPASATGEKDGQQTSIMSMDVSNARFTAFLTDLTKVSPSPDLTSFAGYTSHPPLRIKTRYYAADVSLWCDELPPLEDINAGSTDTGLEEWASQMLSTEAHEVREVIGGIVVLWSFNAADNKQAAAIQDAIQYIAAVHRLRESIEDSSGRDVPTILSVQDVTPSAAAARALAPLSGESIAAFVQKLEEACLEEHGIFGWDIVSWVPENSNNKPASEPDATNVHDERSGTKAEVTRNEYGEKLGMARVLEVLQQVDWSASNAEVDADEIKYDLLSMDELLDSDAEFETPSFNPKIKPLASNSKDAVTAQSDEFQQEIMGLHFALEEQRNQQESMNAQNGDDIQVEQLGNLMERVVAIKEAGSEMSKTDREKFARREVAKIMREMNFGS